MAPQGHKVGGKQGGKGRCVPPWAIDCGRGRMNRRGNQAPSCAFGDAGSLLLTHPLSAVTFKVDPAADL